jgi:hypothetical protein
MTSRRNRAKPDPEVVAALEADLPATEVTPKAKWYQLEVGGKGKGKAKAARKPKSEPKSEPKHRAPRTSRRAPKATPAPEPVAAVAAVAAKDSAPKVPWYKREIGGKKR